MGRIEAALNRALEQLRFTGVTRPARAAGCPTTLDDEARQRLEDHTKSIGQTRDAIFNSLQGKDRASEVWRSKSSANLEYQRVLEELEAQEATPAQQPAPTPPPDSKPRGRRRNSVTTYTVDLASLGRGDSSSLVAAPQLQLATLPASLLRTRTSLECFPLTSEPNDAAPLSSPSLTRIAAGVNVDAPSNIVPSPRDPHSSVSGNCPAPAAGPYPYPVAPAGDFPGRGPGATGAGCGRPGSAVWSTRLQMGSTPASGGLPRDCTEHAGHPVAMGGCNPAAAGGFHPCPPPSGAGGAAAASSTAGKGSGGDGGCAGGPVAVSVSSALAARRQGGGLTVRLPALRRGVTTEGPSPGSCTSRDMSPTAQGSPAGGCGAALHSPGGPASPGFSPGPLSGCSVTGEGSAAGRWGSSGAAGVGSRRLCGGQGLEGAGGSVQRSDSQGSWAGGGGGGGGGGDEGSERGGRAAGAFGRRGSVLHVGSAEELLDVDFMEDTGRWFDAGDTSYLDSGCPEALAALLDGREAPLTPRGLAVAGISATTSASAPYPRSNSITHTSSGSFTRGPLVPSLPPGSVHPASPGRCASPRGGLLPTPHRGTSTPQAPSHQLHHPGAPGVEAARFSVPGDGPQAPLPAIPPGGRRGVTASGYGPGSPREGGSLLSRIPSLSMAGTLGSGSGAGGVGSATGIRTAGLLRRGSLAGASAEELRAGAGSQDAGTVGGEGQGLAGGGGRGLAGAQQRRNSTLLIQAAGRRATAGLGASWPNQPPPPPPPQQ